MGSGLLSVDMDIFLAQKHQFFILVHDSLLLDLLEEALWLKFHPLPTDGTAISADLSSTTLFASKTRCIEQ